MNSQERMEAVFSGKYPDRPPVSMTLSLYGAGLSRCPLVKYYASPEAYALGQELVRQTFEPDILFAPFAISLYGQAFGGKLRFYENQPPNLRIPALVSPKNFKSLSLPDPDSNPCLLYIRRSIRLMAARHGGIVPIAGVALDPMSLPIMIMGLDNWLNTFLFDWGMAQEILAWLQPFFREWVNLLFEEGASFVVLPMAFATPSILPRKQVVKRCLPTLKQAFSEVDIPLVIHSTGAPLGEFLDLFAPLPHVKGVVLNSKDSFKQAREKGGDPLILMGNLESLRCGVWTVQQVRKKCELILQDRKKDPCFILGTSGADIPLDTSPDIIDAIRHSVEGMDR